MYNLNTVTVPSYIQYLIPTLDSEISDYSLRNNRNISVPHNQTSILQKSCIPSVDFELKKVLLPPPREFCRHILS